MLALRFVISGRAAVAVLTLVAALALGACGTGGGRSKSGTPITPQCDLTESFNYIVRTVRSGVAASAQEVGNVNFATCTNTLTYFAKSAERVTNGKGIRAPNICKTIAKASDNPDYPINATPAPPLKKVLASVGSLC